MFLERKENNSCIICGATTNLNLHHVRYTDTKIQNLKKTHDTTPNYFINAKITRID